MTEGETDRHTANAMFKYTARPKTHHPQSTTATLLIYNREAIDIPADTTKTTSQIAQHATLIPSEVLTDKNDCGATTDGCDGCYAQCRKHHFAVTIIAAQRFSKCFALQRLLSQSLMVLMQREPTTKWPPSPVFTKPYEGYPQ